MFADSLSPDPASPQSQSQHSFLDHPISLDAPLATSRACAPAEEIDRISRKTSSGLDFGTGERIRTNAVGTQYGSVGGKVSVRRDTGEILVFNRTESGGVAGEEVAGRTVREVSRLWRYLGGGRPGDE